MFVRFIYYTAPVIIVLLLNSCATILNQRKQYITLYTNAPAEVIYQGDTFATHHNKVELYVPRQHDPSLFQVRIDTTEKKFMLQSRKSFMYWFNIYANYGLGMLIDKNTPKQYGYRRNVYLNSANGNRFDPKNYPVEKERLNMTLSIPYINGFFLRPEGEMAKKDVGFWGIAAGLEYYYSTTQFLVVSLAAPTGFRSLQQVIDTNGMYERMSSRYISVSNNHRLKRFSLGYGISFARNTWSLNYSDRFDAPPPPTKWRRSTHNAIGFIFPAYYQFGRTFHLGAIYRPTIARVSAPAAFQYEHLISIDLAWKIPLH